MKRYLTRQRDNVRARLARRAAPPFHTCRVVFERNFSDPALQRLEQSRRVVTSQWGEDGLIEHIFSTIGTRNSWCVEFGAWDGKHLSNTWNLIENKDWRGVLIEGDRDRAAKLPKTFSKPDRHHYIHALVGWEGEHRMDALLAGTDIPRDFDLLSIDVDGVDWHILNGMTAYAPRVIVVEYNPAIPNSVAFVQAARGDISQGASLRALRDLAREKGYELIFTTETNAIFVIAEDYPAFGLITNDLHVLNPSNRHVLQTFELFDGTMVHTGREHMLWQRRRRVVDGLGMAVDVQTEPSN
jgi:hypothetical protein